MGDERFLRYGFTRGMLVILGKIGSQYLKQSYQSSTSSRIIYMDVRQTITTGGPKDVLRITPSCAPHLRMSSCWTNFRTLADSMMFAADAIFHASNAWSKTKIFRRCAPPFSSILRVEARRPLKQYSWSPDIGAPREQAEWCWNASTRMLAWEG